MECIYTSVKLVKKKKTVWGSSEIRAIVWILEVSEKSSANVNLS